MNFVKYFSPGSRFNAQKFAQIARDNDISCVALASGDVIIDKDALNSKPENALTPWLRTNKSGINNPWCTAKPTEQDCEEIFG